MNDQIEVTVVSYADRKNLLLRYVDPVTGERKMRSAGTSNKEKARHAAGKWETELQHNRYHRPVKMTLDEFIDRYHREHLASLAEATVQSRHSAFNHLKRAVNPCRLAVVTDAVISDFQAKLREEGMRETTLAGHLRHLKAALQWAKGQKLIREVPKFNMPKKAKGINKTMRGRPITVEEFERMLAKVGTIRKREPEKWVRLLHGLWLSGLRLGEALALSWDEDSDICVYLGRRTKLRIYAEAQKNHTDQFHPIVPEFEEFLLATPKHDRRGLVFGIYGPSGRPLTTKRASRYVSDFGQAAGVVVDKDDGKFASAHDLRRAFGTRWAKKVMPPVLQKLMRHGSIDTTMKFYVAFDADEISDDLWRDHATPEQQISVGATV